MMHDTPTAGFSILQLVCETVVSTTAKSCAAAAARESLVVQSIFSSLITSSMRSRSALNLL